MKRRYKWFGLVVVLSLSACSHGKLERQLDQKLAQENSVKSRRDLSQEASERINAISGLSPEQRNDLLTLRDSTQKEMDDLTQQSLRLRSVLIQDLVSTHYDEDEVALVKRRIREVEEKRVSTIFDAADRANQILGREAMRHQHVIYDFMDGGRGHFD